MRKNMTESNTMKVNNKVIRISRRGKEKIYKMLVRVTIFAVLVLLGTYIFAGVAKSAERREREEAIARRDVCEDIFVKDVRSALSEAGLENSGINLTRIGEEGSGWEYTLSIHHHKLTDNSERQETIEGMIKSMNSLADCNGLTVLFF